MIVITIIITSFIIICIIIMRNNRINIMEKLEILNGILKLEELVIKQLNRRKKRETSTRRTKADPTNQRRRKKRHLYFDLLFSQVSQEELFFSGKACYLQRSALKIIERCKDQMLSPFKLNTQRKKTMRFNKKKKEKTLLSLS